MRATLALQTLRLEEEEEEEDEGKGTFLESGTLNHGFDFFTDFGL